MSLTKIPPAMIGSGTGSAQAFAPGVPIYENTTSITQSYTITTGSNGFSIGPVNIASGASVSVPAGNRWLIF